MARINGIIQYNLEKREAWGNTMDLTGQEVRYIRLYKQGLIVPFDGLAALFARLEIQAQNEADAFFNVNQRLRTRVKAEEIQKVAIRIWSVRNTIFLMGREHYDRAVFINGFIDNWFRRMRIVTAEDEAEVQKIIDLCRDKEFVSVEDLVEAGCSKSFIRVWSGAFIEMARRGVLKSKFKKQLEINHDPVSGELTLDGVMRMYFDVYGPATLGDFKHWLGKSSAEVNEAFDRIRGDYVQVNGNMLLAWEDLALLEAAREIPLIITGKFDPICLSYRDKTWLIDKEHNGRVWGKAGIVEAVILIDGVIAATWRKDKAGVNIYPIGKLTKRQQQKITAGFRKIFAPSLQVTFR